jgi:hypothetical protein
MGAGLYTNKSGIVSPDILFKNIFNKKFFFQPFVGFIQLFRRGIHGHRR